MSGVRVIHREARVHVVVQVSTKTPLGHHLYERKILPEEVRYSFPLGEKPEYVAVHGRVIKKNGEVGLISTSFGYWLGDPNSRFGSLYGPPPEWVRDAALGSEA